MIQPTPPSPTNGQVGEQVAPRLAGSIVESSSPRSADARSWSGANMSGWLQLFPACELDGTLAASARRWSDYTLRECLILWSSAKSGLRFAFAGDRPISTRPEWMLRLVTLAEPSAAVVGTLNCNPGIPGWLRWLVVNCGERDLLVVPLALDGISAQGQLCFIPTGRSVPAIDPVGLEVTTRALWQATLFESRLQQQKLSALAELAAGAGHEINNPLGTILGRSQQLLRDEQHPERRRWLSTIGSQALRIRDMIGDLMLFARPAPPRLGRVDLTKIVSEVAAKLAGGHAGIDIEREIADGVFIEADPTQVEIVVSELMRNSITALSGKGVIRIAAERASSLTDPRKAVIQMSFADNGPGLSPLEREHLFDPFFSGRQAGRGLGFGLSKCWQILRAHGGSIRVASAGGDCDSAMPGLTLILEWPAADA